MIQHDVLTETWSCDVITSWCWWHRRHSSWLRWRRHNAMTSVSIWLYVTSWHDFSDAGVTSFVCHSVTSMTSWRDDVGVTLRDVVTSRNVTLRNAALHIKNLNRSDQLNYLCTVANNFGYSNLTIFVRVKGMSKQTCRIRFGWILTIITMTILDIIIHVT